MALISKKRENDRVTYIFNLNQNKNKGYEVWCLIEKILKKNIIEFPNSGSYPTFKDKKAHFFKELKYWEKDYPSLTFNGDDILEMVEILFKEVSKMTPDKEIELFWVRVDWSELETLGMKDQPDRVLRFTNGEVVEKQL